MIGSRIGINTSRKPLKSTDHLNTIEPAKSNLNNICRKDAISIIEKWSEELKFPINSFSEFVRKAGNKPIVLSHRSIDIRELKDKIPVYYFPFASHENFMEKAVEIISKWNEGK